jgi:hypothetical protein
MGQKMIDISLFGRVIDDDLPTNLVDREFEGVFSRTGNLDTVITNVSDYWQGLNAGRIILTPKDRKNSRFGNYWKRVNLR